MVPIPCCSPARRSSEKLLLRYLAWGKVATYLMWLGRAVMVDRQWPESISLETTGV